jgi:hypothetical protein
MTRKLFLSLLFAAAVVPVAVAAKSARGKAEKSAPTLVAARMNGVSAVRQAARGALQRDVHGGITEEERALVLKSVLNSLLLGANRYRVMAVNETLVKVEGGVQQRVYTMVYDYSQNRQYLVVNDITGGIPGAIIQSEILDTMGPPTAEEYAEARQLTLGTGDARTLMKRENVFIQEGFPVDSPSPCEVDRCVQMQVNELLSDGRVQFLLLVTVDLSTRQVVEARVPKTPTSLER